MNIIRRYSVKEHVFVTILFLQVIAIFWYYNPISEKITCDADYNCKVEHVYMGKIKRTTDLKLSRNVIFYHAIAGNGWDSEYHILYDVPNSGLRRQHLIDRSVCSFRYNDYYARNACNRQVRRELKNFRSYIINPENGIILEGDGGINYLKNGFLALLMIYIIAMITDRPLTIIKEFVFQCIRDIKYLKD
ncbi:hypothetical protein IJO12_06975 [bacterium]|nr:hypothetical protein [bacterium]